MKTRKNTAGKQNNRIGVLICLAIGLAVFLVTGCINRSGDGDRAAQTERESSLAVERTFIRHSTGEITFDVESDWIQAEGTNMFFTKEKKQVYGLNGSSPLTSRTPQEFFDDLDILYALDPDRNDDRTRYQVCRDTFYALILHNDKLVLSPEEEQEQEQGHDTLYIGYYIPELESADLTNANTGSHFTWTYKGKSEKISAE